MTAPLGGKLLVANPQLPDPNFDRTVVLLLAHGDEGALGVVLNRPSTTGVGTPLPLWEDRAAAPAVVFVGGPVNSSAAICLGRVPKVVAAAADEAPGEGWSLVTPGIGTVDLERDPDDLVPGPSDVRVFAGYAGWGAGQLEGELSAGAWWVLDAIPEDIFGPDPEDLWRRVLRRQPGSLALVSAYPADPRMN